MCIPSFRRSASSVAAVSPPIHRPEPAKRLEPMLPALLRIMTFFATLATPFIVALLIR